MTRSIRFNWMLRSALRPSALALVSGVYMQTFHQIEFP
jgi:hypothetical protein